jgi:hypothetical protein
MFIFAATKFLFNFGSPLKKERKKESEGKRRRRSGDEDI